MKRATKDNYSEKHWGGNSETHWAESPHHWNPVYRRHWCLVERKWVLPKCSFPEFSYYKETLHIYNNSPLLFWYCAVYLHWTYFFKSSYFNLYNKVMLLGGKNKPVLWELWWFFEFPLQNCWNLEWTLLWPEMSRFYRLHQCTSDLVACLYKKQVRCWKIEVAW